MPGQIDILRHGEPVGGKRYRGDRIDDPLSERGWAQMRDRVVGLEAAGKANWTHIVSSPLIRCRAFAEALAAERGLPLLIDVNLRERGFGCWEGLSHREVKERYAADYRAYKADPDRGMPTGGEAMDAFFSRVTGTLARHAKAQPSDGKTLIVAHAVVIRAAAVWALNAPPVATHFVDTEYACLLRLRWRGEQPSLLELLND
ncbi:MAG: histidine phosphatase family protein [Halothiobacillus sp.]|nr:histidine phosphatase family protein [Halothiobacillus sp.]